MNEMKSFKPGDRVRVKRGTFHSIMSIECGPGFIYDVGLYKDGDAVVWRGNKDRRPDNGNAWNAFCSDFELALPDIFSDD